jgi:hypothetical protein
MRRTPRSHPRWTGVGRHDDRLVKGAPSSDLLIIGEVGTAALDMLKGFQTGHLVSRHAIPGHAPPAEQLVREVSVDPQRALIGGWT